MKAASVALLFALAWSGLAAQEPAEPPAREELARRIDAYVAPLLAAGQLSGHLLVARGGEVLYERSFGRASFELDVPVTADTRFCVASITKPMTSVIAIRLVEGGALALDDRLSKWLPAFPRGDEITVEQLLRHQAGIPHRVTTPEQEAVPRSTAEMVELAAAAGLDFEPGTKTGYSSGGYAVVARVLELAGGRSYAELLETHVFEPAGMSSSLHPEGYELIPNRAASYLIGPAGERINAPLKHLSFLVGAGSVYSTARDLFRFVHGLASGLYGELARQNWVRNGNVSLNGRTDGYRAFADYHGASDVIAVLTSNLLTGAGDLLRRDVPRIAAGEQVEPPTLPAATPVSVPEEVLRRYEGTYRLGTATDLELEVRDGGVFLGDWTLIVTSPTTFFSPQDYGVVTVVMDEAGRVERLDWEQWGEVYPMARVVD